MKALKKKSVEKTVVANFCKCPKASKADCNRVFGNYGTSAVQSSNTKSNAV